MNNNHCHRLAIPENTCYIQFENDQITESNTLGLTSRGEELIADYNQKGKIIGIELLGSPKAPKPCQKNQPAQREHRDKNGQLIEPGDTVEWDDGEGTRTAIVTPEKNLRCIANRPKKNNWAVGNIFRLDHTFMYEDTENYLTITKKGRDQ